ncbi:hypothetical protein F7725_013765 [Dissostichus mawsoni]|uniref:Stonustoxin-like helical domain-containing protein n=1 Tax=Dissostichus mawsoni TaxID=36200 RepID=A0A7J5YX46_DISMA|nr:hypothetical protein F7725_013765 [Dissostichus mawsoni]
MPLKSFDPKQLADEGISIELVRKAQEALEDLKETQMRCNDSLEDKVVESFPVLHEELSTFLKLCGYYKTNIQKPWQRNFPPSVKERKMRAHWKKSLKTDPSHPSTMKN